MKILLNGEAFATDAKTLDELCARLGFAEAKIATAVNGSFVAVASRGGDAIGRSRRDRDRGAEAGRLMLTLYGKDFTSRLLLGTAQYPSPESLKQAVAASGAEIVTVSVRREVGPVAHRPGLLGADRGARLQGVA